MSASREHEKLILQEKMAALQAEIDRKKAGNAQASATSGPSRTPRPVQPQLAQPCRFFLSGFCRDGAHCSFRHVSAAAATLARTSVALPTVPAPPSVPSSSRAAPAAGPDERWLGRHWEEGGDEWQGDEEGEDQEEEGQEESDYDTQEESDEEGEELADDEPDVGAAADEEAGWWRHVQASQEQLQQPPQPPQPPQQPQQPQQPLCGGPFAPPEPCLYGGGCRFRATCSRHHCARALIGFNPGNCFCEQLDCAAGHPLRAAAFAALSAEQRRALVQRYTHERQSYRAQHQRSLEEAVLAALRGKPGGASGRLAKNLLKEIGAQGFRCGSTIAVGEALERLRARGEAQLLPYLDAHGRQRWLPTGLSDAQLREPPLSKRDAKKQAKGQARPATLGGGSDHQQWIEQAARQGLLNQAAGIKCTKRQKKAVKWLPKLGAPRVAALKSAIGKEAAERRANAQAARQLAGAKELLKAHNRGEAAPVSGKKLKKAKALVASQHTCPSCGLGFKKLKQLQKHAANSRAGHNQCGQQARFPPSFVFQ